MLLANRFRLSGTIDFLLGVLVALPFKYPDEPFYWLAFLAFIISFFRLKFEKDNIIYLYAVFSIALMSLLANFYTPIAGQVNYLSAIASSITFFFFLFRYGTVDSEKFFNGFLLISKCYAILVPVAFIYLKPFSKYGNFFVSSEARMWADGVFPEWPNVFCVFVVLSFFIFIIRKMHFWAVLSMFSALLTTSRMALLGLVIYVIFVFLNANARSKFFITFSFLLLSGALFYYFYDNNFLLDYIEVRLFKTEDREIIFDTLYATIIEYPLGIGNVPFEYLNDAFESYHSSFLKVAVRYGVFSLVVFLFIIFPRGFFANLKSYYNVPIIFLILVGIVQDMLFHAHFILLYSVFLKYRSDNIYETK